MPTINLEINISLGYKSYVNIWEKKQAKIDGLVETVICMRDSPVAVGGSFFPQWV